MSKVVASYLAKYAEPEISWLDEISRVRPTPNAVVIPAYNENTAFLQRWVASPLSQQGLLILVINQPDVIEHPTQDNLTLWHTALDLLGAQTESVGNLVYGVRDQRQIIIIDRFRHVKIPRKQGVGLARKIGCDLAVSLFQRGLLSHTGIYSSDADATLPINYFTRPIQSANIAAQVFDFTHTSEDKTLHSATQLYERAIKYYAKALQWAGSPYGFNTIGSILCINIAAYCQVRGFPKKAAGEDFYLLNKLAKVGEIKEESSINLDLEARLSDRVPFGTGPSVTKIVEQQLDETTFVYYAFDIFVALKQLVDTAPRLYHHIHEAQPLSNLPLSSETKTTLDTLGIDTFFTHARKQCRNQAQFNRQFNCWFDGFLTLKFIHHMQSLGHSSLPLIHCLQAYSHREKQL